MPEDKELEELLPTEIELTFEKSNLYKLYRSGWSQGINPERWDRVRRDIRFEDVVADLTGHSGTTSIRCPFHGRDSRPSFWLYKRTNDGWCFGCLDESEPIWTVESGLKTIGDIEIGDRVYDRYGEQETILHKESKQGELLAIETKNFKIPLLLTPDHTCFFIKKQDAIQSLPFINKRGDRISFFNAYKKDPQFCSDTYQSPITEGRADSIVCGDYLLFPVIPHRYNLNLPNPAIKSHFKESVPYLVSEFPVHEDTCRLFGLYLAKGSTNSIDYPSTVRWTFHVKEASTLGTFVKNTLLQIFNLQSTLTTYPDHNICEVVCYNDELAQGLSYWFGSGDENKKIPPIVLAWSQSVQISLLAGYLEGYGDKGNCSRATIASQTLAFSLWAIGVQSGKLPVLGHTEAYVDKKGISHKESWTIEFKRRESIHRFHYPIKGHNYYWSEVSKVNSTGHIGTVVDIIVSGSESFLTKLGAVHNCPPKEQYYDHVRFVSKYLGINRTSALCWLEKKWDLPIIADIIPEEEEIDTIELQFTDLQEPFILKAIKQVQGFQDVELAEDYLYHYFKAIQCLKFAEDAKKGGELDDASTFETKANLTLARALTKEEIDHIFSLKQVRR